MQGSRSIPVEASPHEVAILEKLLLGWSQKQVKNHLHYMHVSSISRVQTKYANLLAEVQYCSQAN